MSKCKLLFVTCLCLTLSHASRAGTVTCHTGTSTTWPWLHYADGTVATTTVHLTGVDVAETYDGTTHPTTATYNAISGVWATTIRFRFSDSSWYLESSAIAFAVNDVHYVVTYNSVLFTYSLTPRDYFSAPTSSAVTGLAGTYTASDSYSDVSPKVFHLGDLTVDPGDLTGKTGMVTYNSSTSTDPWSAFPGGLTVTTVGNPTSWLVPIVWLFPVLGSPGEHSTISPTWAAMPVAP